LAEWNRDIPMMLCGFGREGRNNSGESFLEILSCIKLFHVFEGLHLFEQTCNKYSSIVKYYYNLKCLQF